MQDLLVKLLKRSSLAKRFKQMLGHIDPQIKEATVVGAGIAGLLAADALDHAGYRVTLIEASDRSGGLIQTTKTELGIAEAAAHSILASPAVLQLLHRFNLPYFEVNPQAKARYILRNGKPKRFPLRAWEVLVLLFCFFFRRSKISSPESRDDLTLQVWCKTHLGQAACDYLLSPFLIGIYGALPHQLSVQAAFPSLMIRKGRSFFTELLMRALRRGNKKKSERPKMIVLKSGMSHLVLALTDSLKQRLGERFKLGNVLKELPAVPNLILCVPAGEAAKLLISESLETSQALAQVEYAPLISSTVFIKKSQHQAPQGVGVLIPPKENREILGVLYNSSSFPGRVRDPQEISSYTVMMGGTLRPEVLSKSDEEICDQITGELTPLFSLRGKPEKIIIHRWEKAIPKYSPALLRVWETARQNWCATPGQVLFGNYTGQVSLRGMMESVEKLVKVVA